MLKQYFKSITFNVSYLHEIRICSDLIKNTEKKDFKNYRFSLGSLCTVTNVKLYYRNYIVSYLFVTAVLS